MSIWQLSRAFPETEGKKSHYFCNFQYLALLQPSCVTLLLQISLNGSIYLMKSNYFFINIIILSKSNLQNTINIKSDNTVCNFLLIRLKINSMSQSCRCAFVFRCAFDSAKFKLLIFFCLLTFFPFLMNLLVKIYMKRCDRHNKTLWTTDFFNSVFGLVSCSSKNQAVTDSNLTALLLRGKKKFKKCI